MLQFKGNANGNGLADRYGLNLEKIGAFFTDKMKALNKRIDQPNQESTIENTVNEMLEAIMTAFPNLESDVLVPYLDAKKIDPMELLELRNDFHFQLRTKVLKKRTGYR